MVEWASIISQKEKGVKLAQGSLLPDLSGGPWSYNTGPVPNSGMPEPGPEFTGWGPKGDGRKLHESIEDYLLMFWEDIAEDLASWTNYYAAEQPVKVVRKTRQYIIYEPVELGSEGQQWRCGDATAKAAWEKIDKWEIIMVLAVLLRGAAKKCSSMEALWQTYDDVGCDLVRTFVERH
jgi:hypothetical protein